MPMAFHSQARYEVAVVPIGAVAAHAVVSRRRQGLRQSYRAARSLAITVNQTAGSVILAVAR